jgi:hypothetical protein
MNFNYDGGGVGKGATVTLLVDRNEVGKGRIDETVPTRYSMTEAWKSAETPVCQSARTIGSRFPKV